MTIEVSLGSPPDRDRLTASLMVDGVEVIEVNQERDRLRVEIYPRPDRRPWHLDLAELVDALAEAERRLGR